MGDDPAVLRDHTTTHRQLTKVIAERGRQDDKHGAFRDYPDGIDPSQRDRLLRTEAQMLCDAAVAVGRATWAHVVREEFLELMCETDPARIELELVQLVAAGVAWLEAIERRGEGGRFDRRVQRDKLGAPVPPESDEEMARRHGHLELLGASFCPGCSRLFGHHEDCTAAAATADLVPEQTGLIDPAR